MLSWLDPNTILAATGPWALVVVALIVFAETGLLIGFFLPGDSLVFLLGMLTGVAQAENASLAELPLWLVLVVIPVVAFIGDQTGYTLGRASLRSRRVSGFMHRGNVQRIERASIFFGRYGGPAIVLARFIPIIRTFVPFAAGLAGYGRPRFAFWNAAGAALWGVGLPLAGHWLGSIPWIADHVDLILIGIIVVSLLPLGIKLLTSRLRRDRAEA
ncbi:DedA family protein [Pseudoclavibacter caeni]|uniref:DedA family protein n=1 Tax=Pseudoclavibacter caeni TaxID=908846 RepID=A0A7C8FXT7_9MICO|nr:DedA family protein [Pseudoclavibacter caeni]KAB1631962.1 DedA family protein [Pseudoclavibacter caeni]NYJ96836.1 membrane-associated protein [Pseudoclavibacter caeni]